jgi:hypothetical protein
LGWPYQVARALCQRPQHTATASTASSCSSRQWPPATRARTSTNAATARGIHAWGCRVLAQSLAAQGLRQGVLNRHGRSVNALVEVRWGRAAGKRDKARGGEREEEGVARGCELATWAQDSDGWRRCALAARERAVAARAAGRLVQAGTGTTCCRRACAGHAAGARAWASGAGECAGALGRRAQAAAARQG